LRVEHEKNLLEIKLRQYEEMEAKKAGEEDLKMHQIRELLSQLDEEKRQVERLK
jgi:hypothetical protein